MQINANTTGMPAGLTVATDKDGRQHCVVVVKGTFELGVDGEARLAEEQEPLVYADVHHGDPGTTSVRYECDFAMHKPMTDVIVNGDAVSPTGRPVKQLTVGLEIGGARKEILVIGDRRWESGVLGSKASEPLSFVTMPLVFERSFGGSDHSHPDAAHQGTELRNPVGVGFHKNSNLAAVNGTPLPNLEDPRNPVRKWSDTPAPVGFGSVGRSWQPRIKHAGTYDERWLAERFPFLPGDFDARYFLSAPSDQQRRFLQGGEIVRCLNMTAGGSFAFSVPKLDVPISFRFRDLDAPKAPNLDTLIVEPNRGRFLAVWRASAQLGRKLNALSEVVIGSRARHRTIPLVDGKRRFQSLEELAAWNRERAP
jgi:hypothetical protein